MPQPVTEENWFFRLSRYAGPLREAITSEQLRIEPAGRRHEVLAFIDGGLADFSVSRPAARAGGWGLPVPGDDGQVIYVWFDALCNYVTALGYGTQGTEYRRFWAGEGRRLHLLGKGVLRFHAVYWPAMLLSSGQPLPTGIFVHDYLTTGGRKISKSAGPADSDTVTAWSSRTAQSSRAVRSWTRPAVRPVHGSPPRSKTSTSGGPRRRSGPSRTRRIGWSTGSSPGRWPGPTGMATAAPPSRAHAWTQHCASCSRRARSWAGS